jgi:hypothetical protein
MSAPEPAVATGEQIQTGLKKGRRGMAKASLSLIEAMRAIAEETQPITGRGVGYKLFSRGLIGSMALAEMQRVYRLLKLAREQGTIEWGWIVDETRELEINATWDDPEDFIRSIQRNYRREFWNNQPVRCILVSEKGTVRGVLKPVLDALGVGFLPVHGFNSATCVHNLAESDDGRQLILLYVGDYDPSGMFMSEEDLPARLKQYGGGHVEVRRVALTPAHTTGLLSFPAADKRKDPRYRWFASHHGDRCWELDAMDPRDLRDCVEAAIKELIDPEEWARCETVNAAEKTSIRDFLRGWESFGQPDWIDAYLQAAVSNGEGVSP